MTPTLAQVVKQVESSAGAAQLRFEPDCYKALQMNTASYYTSAPEAVLAIIERANRCSPATAEAIFATSWGWYQDMGFEIYGELFPAIAAPTIWDWLGSVALQDQAFARWCARHGFVDSQPLPSDLARFAREYNGPDAVEQYAALLQRAAVQLTGTA